ncbi:MAG: glycosyltransferase [Bacteroidota bacterium]|jgi:glycosyltransferase involved in cell wall biosynthesis|nr:glycosyltransferase [Bacteroidota bacterium]
MQLSIITINFNNAYGLRKTIESVVNQTFKDFEYIVIDGASSDDSVDLIKNYQKDITYWVSEKDRGIYHAMNKGIKKATGEYCLFLNSGDWLINSNVLENVFDFFPDKDIVYGNLENSYGVDFYSDELKYSTFFYSSIGHPVSFIRKNLFDKIGLYNESLQIVSDWEFFIIALFKYSCSYQHIDIVITFFEGGGVSSNELSRQLQIDERREVLKQQFPLMYDDYMELMKLRSSMRFYESSKLIQFVKWVQNSNVYRKIRKVNKFREQNL